MFTRPVFSLFRSVRADSFFVPAHSLRAVRLDSPAPPPPRLETNVDTGAALTPPVALARTPNVDRLLRTIERGQWQTAAYARAMTAWPAHVPLWPRLTSLSAQKAMISYLINRKPYTEADRPRFVNACTGYATETYVRYSTRAALRPDELARLPQVGVQPDREAEKFRMPVQMASYWGHYFNAVLVDEAHPENVASYVFFEPQLGTLIEPGSETYRQYVNRAGIDLDDLRSFNERLQYGTETSVRFVMSGAGDMVPMASTSQYRFQSNLFVADRDAATFAGEVSSAGFADAEAYARQRAKVHGLTDADILALGRLVEGRLWRASLDSRAEPLTPALYLRILGRPDLLSQWSGG